MNLSRTQSAGGIWLRLMLFLVILCGGLALAWMILLPVALTKFVGSRTGFSMGIQSLYANPFTGRLAVRGLAVKNPPTFPDPAFADIREVRVDWQVSSLFSRRLVIEDVVIDVAGVTLVRDSHGAFNAWVFHDRLAGAPAGQTSARPAAGAPAEAKSRPREFLVKRLQLRCDRMVIADYSKSQPAVREVALNFNHTYENITSAKQLAAPLVDLLAPQAGGVLRGAGDAMKESGRKAGEAVKGLFDTLEKSLRK
jgi:hypothetical protein